MNNDLKLVDPTPFQLLGIEPTNNIHEIKSAYKRMLLMIHPDKASKIKWTKEEKNEAFRKIRKAYKTIIKDYKFHDVPDYDIEYNVDNEDMFQNKSEILEYRNNFKHDIKEFNKMFDKKKQKDQEMGMEDPYSRGYVDFNRKHSENIEHQLTKEYKPKPKSSKSHKLVHRNSLEHNYSNGTYEFGLTNVGDFSVKNNSKNGLLGSDISQVFDDTEIWEMSAMRNDKLKNKYNDDKNVNEKLKELRKERSNLDIKNEYKKAESNESEENMVLTRRLKKARDIQKQRDKYYQRKNLTN